MQHIFFSSTPSTTTALLIKTDAFNKQQLEHHYIKPLEALGTNRDEIVAFDLEYNQSNKAPAKESKEYLNKLLKALQQLNVTTLLVADSTYFKYLTGIIKVATARGYVHKCSIHPYKDMSVVLSTNYTAVYHNDTALRDVEMSLATLHSHLFKTKLNVHTPTSMFTEIIHTAEYPNLLDEVRLALSKLHKYPSLTVDIETFSLRFEEAGIGTIAFAWDKHNGIAFEVDVVSIRFKDEFRRHLVKKFLLEYKGQLIFHNKLFDAKVIIYTLFMNHDSDWVGLRQGIEVLKLADDSMVLAFLATNSTADAPLGLKELAYEFTGKYGVDVTDITKIPLPDLLEYNLKDCLATWYVYEKYLPIVHADNQWQHYVALSKPTLDISLEMMLVGLPMNMSKVANVKQQLTLEVLKQNTFIKHNPSVKKAQYIINRAAWKSANEKLKKKVKPLSDFQEPFNAGSSQQLGILLYDVLKLPVLDTTDSGEPSTGAKVIERLKDHSSAKEHLPLLNAIIQLSKADKVLTTFIKAFEAFAFYRETDDEFSNYPFLNGNLKSVGVVSGRFSSNEPNLTNLPSGSKYGKLIKECFVAPEGWLFVFADFNALEAKINAILTGDPNKIKVYTQGYDSHCLAAYSYFKDDMPDIEDTIASINSIKEKYDELRSASKPCTFA